MSMLPLDIWRRIYNKLDFSDQFALMQSFKILFDTFGTEYMKDLLDTHEHTENTVSKIDEICLYSILSHFERDFTDIDIAKCKKCEVYTNYESCKKIENQNIYWDCSNNEVFHYILPYYRNGDNRNMFYDIYCQNCFDVSTLCTKCDYIVLNYDAKSEINLCEECKKK
jgi:hypothetical protein